MANNKSEYDMIGIDYVELTENSWRLPIENYTLHKCMLQSLLDEHELLTGKRVLDLACGHGLYTRELKALNCDYILGVDISSEMIKIANDIEYQEPKGIEYQVADAKQLKPPETLFDLVTAFYLLCYARTRDELLEMAGSIHTQLGENKTFIGFTTNIMNYDEKFDKKKYGISRQVNISLEERPIPDGTKVFINLYNKDEKKICTFTNYHFSAVTYEQVFKESGFKTFQWIPFQCDPRASNKELYDQFLQCPNGIGIIATK
ncbi:unnamed protein product [Rotaria magnacalcarata]|uniref:Methyltransferase domain-containing protein n=1 Tax=Rotaria magnacalcarata TaxID=392030 RepID=A0A815Z2Q3_9BILA|nr:unnamed protein product [Rotaria magnacalcarata]CAF2196458.1 unnamed protein product [Rotaria magnacalcarata]CAF4123477.1 unnamed protein product [Rotaria magnacalcarata]CAF4140395.1 unnamed protein product [Rotaria magnacalcarata]CAF4223750.1 unnamed protein product [Rotaria magnacalcarata]